MTVAQLIEKLKALDPEAQVVTSDCCYGLDFEPTVEAKRYYWAADESRKYASEYEDGMADWLKEWHDEPVIIASVVVID